MAPLRHAIELSECPLIGVDPKSSAEGKNGAFDPSATLAMHCGNGFDGGFSLYQSTHLNR
jgi:hypothetical protein